MEKKIPYPQSVHLFGHSRAWYVFDHREDPLFDMPEHLADQVFRVIFCRPLSGHYFEILVSEQFPKGSYVHLGQALRKLGPQRFCACVLHGRNHGAHLLFWDGIVAQQFYHLDLDFTQIGQFDRSVITHLAAYDEQALDRVFPLLQGKQMGDRFQAMLTQHLSLIECKSAVAYNALIDFTLKIVFLLFVQRKGWLNFDPFYLASQMERCAGKGLSIVQAFLRPLFARLEGHDAACMISLGDLPQLGGGMFVFNNADIPSISNGWCLELYQKLMGHFSFSLFEGDCQSKIVGISPEILGHVFENLLDSDERKQTGTFFTPPDMAEKQVRASFDAYFANPAFKDASAYVTALHDLRVLDPACGSGTFLVAAYREILARRLQNAPLRERYNGRLFALKREVVTRNLLGIDLNPMAVRLTEVRLWLHMIQDLEVSDPNLAPQLPSLQHHLRPGDFLQQYVPNMPHKIRDWPKFAMLEKLRRKFPRTGGRRRSGLLKHIHRLENELASYLLDREDAPQRDALRERFAQGSLPGVEGVDRREELGKVRWSARPEMHHHMLFCDVFLRGGFDLILGNPPWLSAVKVGQKRRAHIMSWQPHFAGLKMSGRADLSLYFLTSALSRLRPNGHLSLLLPGKFLQAGYAGSLRQYLLRHTRLDFLFDFGIDQRVVFKADTFPLVIGLSNTRPEPGDQVAVEIVSKGQQKVLQRSQGTLADQNGCWVLERGETQHVPDGAVLLGEKVSIHRGVVTNAKRWFVFAEKPAGFHPEHLQPLLRGRDIQNHRLSLSHWIYWPFANPNWRDQQTEKESRWLQGSGKLRRDRFGIKLPYTERELPAWVLIWPYLCSEFRVALIPAEQWVPDQTCYYIGFSSFAEAYRYFAFLNSEQAQRQLLQIAQRGKDRFFFFYAKTCRNLVLPDDFERHPLVVPMQERAYLPQEGRGLWQNAEMIKEAS
jgi:hypothetical protein